MGIISSLLTGGTIVGKVCQALSSAFTNSANLPNGSNVVVPDLVVGGGKFFKSDDNTEHTMKTYLFNPTSSYISLSMPDVGGSGAIEYVVKPTEKLPIDDCLQGNVEPDSEMMIGPISSPANAGANDVADAAIKLALKNLTIGGPAVNVAGFEFEATTTGLLISAGAIIISSVVYFFMKGRHGVTAENRQEIKAEPVKNSAKNDTNSYKVDIDFAALGFDNGETLDNVKIFMSTDSNALTVANRASKSEPLTDSETEYFKANKMFTE